MSLVVAFARNGVAFSSLRVTVEVDLDVAGGLGVEGAPKGYTAVRCVVDLESDADRTVIDHAMDEAWRNSQIGNVFSRPVPLSSELRLNRARASEA